MVRLFQCNMNGFTSNNKAVPLYCIFHNHNHIGTCSNPEGKGTVKDRDTLIEQSVTWINEAQVVYDKFMKQISTVRYSFNTTGTANYRVQLAMPPSIKNNYNNIIKNYSFILLERSLLSWEHSDFGKCFLCFYLLGCSGLKSWSSLSLYSSVALE